MCCCKVDGLWLRWCEWETYWSTQWSRPPSETKPREVVAAQEGPWLVLLSQTFEAMRCPILCRWKDWDGTFHRRSSPVKGDAGDATKGARPARLVGATSTKVRASQSLLCAGRSGLFAARKVDETWNSRRIAVENVPGFTAFGQEARHICGQSSQMGPCVDG